MSHRIPRFSVTFVASTAVTVLMVYLVFSAGVATGLLPVVGIGGLYADGDGFSGNVGKIYPEYDDGGGAPVGSGAPITDTPAQDCAVRPMIVFDLQNAEIRGTSLRKDIRLPFLSNRYMSLRITQPSDINSGQSAALVAQNVKLFITQLEADRLVIRNIELREGGPNGNQRFAGGDTWGSTSGELYIEGGDTSGNQDPPGAPNLSPGPDINGLEAQNIEAWIHGIEGQQISFVSRDQPRALDLSLEFPTYSEVAQYYDGRLGFNLPEYPNQQNPEYPFQDTERESYFNCNPIPR